MTRRGWTARVQQAAGVVGAFGILGGAALALGRPYADAWAQERIDAALTEHAQAPHAGSVTAADVAAVAQSAQAAEGAAESANALAQQQAALLGALACLQAGGTLVPDGCAFRQRAGVVRVIGLKDVQGLVAELAAKR